MKTKLIVIFVMAFIFACKSPQESMDEGAIIVIFEECEYVMFKAPYGDYGWLMSHKGNCKNPIHKHHD